MLNEADIRRNAALRGHEIGADDRCERCGLSVADMVALQDIPPCDTFGPGRKIERAMKAE